MNEPLGSGAVVRGRKAESLILEAKEFLLVSKSRRVFRRGQKKRSLEKRSST